MKVVKRKIAELKRAAYNPRRLTEKQEQHLTESLTRFGLVDPIIVNVNPDRKDIIIGGHQRLKVWQKLGNTDIDCVEVNLSEEQERELNVRLNKNTGEFDFDILRVEFEVDDLLDWGFESWELNIDDDEGGVVKSKRDSPKLSNRFLVPPFSILDTRQGYWQDRRREWLSLGIKSETGRDAEAYSSNTYVFEDGVQFGIGRSGTSVFDPVLTELSYLWFNMPRGKILDPFAGGSVRGIVASKLGYEYRGNDLREEQIEANYENAREVLTEGEATPIWTAGDSLYIDTIAKGYDADMLFSCPPYADLEVYSDDNRDLSNMAYDEFLPVYRDIIRKSCSLLKDDRFAVFVVSEVRGNRGDYRNFVSDTIRAFLDAGLVYYNELILINSVGNAAMRVGRYMQSRKVARVHQNVLVFYKGDMQRIKDNFPILSEDYTVDIRMETN